VEVIFTDWPGKSRTCRCRLKLAKAWNQCTVPTVDVLPNVTRKHHLEKRREMLQGFAKI